MNDRTISGPFDCVYRRACERATSGITMPVQNETAYKSAAGVVLFQSQLSTLRLLPATPRDGTKKL